MLPYRYPIGLDPRQSFTGFVQPDLNQPQHQTNLHGSSNSSGSPSPSSHQQQQQTQHHHSRSKVKSSGGGANINSHSVIDGMANLTPSLLSASVPFSQAQQQQLQASHQSSGGLPQQMVQPAGTNQRSRVKNRSSNSSSSHSNVGLNGSIGNLSAQPIFGTSVAFPGNPLQSAGGQIQNQTYQHQTSRLNQMQHTSQQGGQTVLLPLEISPSQSRNLVSNSNANVITSNNAAAVAAAVAVAHPQYSQYITSWPCPACKISFRSPNELQTHLSAHLSPSQKQAQSQNSLVGPNLINNTFNASTTTTTSANKSSSSSSKEDQSVHNMKQKDKSVPCNECGKMFANAERVRVHVRVAHGEKTCSCAICGCGFSYRCKLLNHMRTHTGDKPFTCEVCGRSFSQKNHLKRHHMIHTGERPFPCEICGRSFYRKDKLTRHLRIHTNPAPGRGRNSKNSLSSSNLHSIPAGSPAGGIKIPMSQSLSSLPASAIQLLPVPMTNIKSPSNAGQSSWAQIQQSTSNRQNNQTDGIKSEDSSQQASNLMMKPEM